ncbi:MAG: D-glucuronyl C5-epimerase family protein [Gammaproteobacteria bacterium]
MIALIQRAVICVLLAIVCVHYVESYTLPVVEKIRKTLFGEQAYMRAKEGCAAIQGDEWVHPATLSLTAYGTAQRHLGDAYGLHEPEVLQDYAAAPSTDADLRCIADFLLHVAPVERRGGLPVRAFRYDIPKSSYGIESGWYSGLAQSFAGQILLAAHVRFEDPVYLEAAIEVGNLLRVEIGDGGVKIPLADGAIWFEEYAQSGKTPPMVLNGHLLALDYLYWLGRADPAGPWLALFDAGIKSVVGEIDTYAGRAWSYYDALGNLANHKYQRFHIRQLRRYSSHDQSGTLGSAGDAMSRQLWIPAGILQRLATQPSRLILFLVGCFSLMIFSMWTGIRLWVTRR